MNIDLSITNSAKINLKYCKFKIMHVSASVDDKTICKSMNSILCNLIYKG